MSLGTTRVGLEPHTEVGTPAASGPAVPIRINLLPHREARREQRRRDFTVRIVLVAVVAAVAVFGGGVAINQQIALQQERNDFITAENAKLERQIAEMKTLREEIAALQARQQAVQDLQSDRTVPVRLFDELVRLTPEGLYLRQLRQEERRVTLTGYAQTNERVAELLRNLAERSPWLERPELGEIKEVTMPSAGGQKEGRKLFEFSLNALVKRPAAVSPEPKPAARPRAGDPGRAAEPGRSADASEPLRLGALR